MDQIGKGSQYMKSLPNTLKVMEFVTLLSATVCVGYFMDNYNYFRESDYKKKESLELFMFVVAVGWLIVVAHSVFFVKGFHQKITAVNWPLTVAITSALWTVLLLISSALVTDFVKYYDEADGEFLSICEAGEQVEADWDCDQVIGGAVCGFAAMVFFAIDTFIHFRMYMNTPRSTAVADST